MKAVYNGLWLCGLLFGSAATADQFHYNNVLSGDRAAGLGGAFGAVADDASGLVYNPAGLAFALSNDITGSANAMYQKEVTYKKAAFDQDFEEKSSGTMSPFFGGLGKLDHMTPGLVFAFGYTTVDSDLKDQDDLIEKTGGTRFHRTANTRANTNKLSLAVAKRFGGSFAVGFGLSYVMIDELTQVYQDFTAASPYQAYETEDGVRKKDEDGKPIKRNDCCIRTLAQNVRERLQATGVEPMLGVQYAFLEQFSVGLTLKKAVLLTQSYEMGMERSIIYQDINGAAIDIEDTGISTAKNPRAAEPPHYVLDNTRNKKALGEIPTEARFGFAWFASTMTLVTADIMHFTAVEGDVPQYKRNAVTNYALGTEYYLTPSFPIRFGLFTNNDARPKPKATKTDQADSIDYTGMSLFLAFAQPNSQIALGAVLQQGKGKAQKVAGSTEIQDVEALAWNVGFSVSHNF